MAPNDNENNSEAGTSSDGAGPSTSSGSSSVQPADAAAAVITEEQLMLALAAAGDDEDASVTIGQLLTQQAGGFMVHPLQWCPHLSEGVAPVPEGGLDIKSPCFKCQSTEENWVCLACYKVGCGRFVSKHMLEHGEAEKHHLVLSYSDLTVWCYVCQQYVHNKALKEAKESAYMSKFGEVMPTPESWKD